MQLIGTSSCYQHQHEGNQCEDKGGDRLKDDDSNGEEEGNQLKMKRTTNLKSTTTKKMAMNIGKWRGGTQDCESNRDKDQK